MIVDGQEQARFVAASILEHFGLETMLAADYQRAVDAFGSAADNIGLVMLDLADMPTDPAEALRPFRKLRPDVKFLFTRCATADAASMDCGPILTKPYSAQQLASAAREVLGG